MDRQIVYAGQIPLETDLLNTNRNAYTALGMLIQDMFGTSTVFSGLGCVPTSPAGMTVNVNPGRVYSLQQRDPTAYSSLGQDTTNQIMKQGVLLAATNFSCPAPATSGYSINYLISASFLEQDTNAVVLPYYNSANPSQAFSGPPVNGQSSGTAQNTTRQDTIQLTLTAGVAAATGSQQTPATPTGQIALWVVTVAYGQASITASSIAAVAGSPFAPTGGYFQAVGERYSSIINAAVSQTLTTAALGALVNVTATGTTQTLPAASACPNGTSITVVYMQSSGSTIVARNGTDTLSFGQGNSTNSITLSPGEEVQFVSNGSNGWISAGQTLSTGVTPPPGDNSTKLSTTAWIAANTPGRLLNVQVFSNVGSSTYTPTPGTTAVLVRVQGGGGSGGGCAATGSGQISVGSGGSAGAYAESYITSGFSGVAVTVGAGGASVSGQASNNGGTSSFGSLVSAPGGVGGSSAGPTSPPWVTGISPSTIASGGNIVNASGSAGQVSLASSATLGYGGPGGASSFGGGGGAGSSGSNGQSSPSKGAAGGGTMQIQNGGALSGGAGGNGIVIVYEFGSH